MPITIYGTDWCDDTSRTRAFLAAKGIRPKFIDIEARPEEARHLSTGGRPISIPILIFSDGARLDDPSQEELEAAIGSQGMTVDVRHRTKLNKALSRFEQYRDDLLVTSADFIDREGTIVIVGSRHHEPRNPALDDENIQRLTSGLVEIINRSGRTVEISSSDSIETAETEPGPSQWVETEIDTEVRTPIWRESDPRVAPWPDPNDPLATEPITPTESEAAGTLDAPTNTAVDVGDDALALLDDTREVSATAQDQPAETEAADAEPTEPPEAEPPAPVLATGSTGEALQPDLPVAVCPLTQLFTELWSSGADHRAAAQLARAEGVSRLAAIKGLHDLWEMPLTPEAMTLAFGEPVTDDLAAMFHVLGWIIDQNPGATMSELQAFDDATGVSVKTQALSLAKRPLDTIAIVDRMGPGLHVRTIDENRAREMASATIREADGLLRIQDQSTLRLSFGWIFLYQSVEFMDSGDYSKMISGNAPLLVDRFTGALWITDTAERPDAYASNYLATGNPLTPASSAQLDAR